MLYFHSMEIKELKKRPLVNGNKKLTSAYNQFVQLINELRKRDLPIEIINAINNEIKHLNSIPESGKVLKKEIKKSQSRILKLIEKELKLVTKNHYRNTWMPLGMAAFGIPIGVVFGASLGNMAFLGIGLPLGMVMGLALGSGMDKKAFDAGNQLQIEITY